MNIRAWISVLCSLLLGNGLLHSTKAVQPWESKQWLSLYHHPQEPLKHPDELSMSLQRILENPSSLNTFGKPLDDNDTNEQEEFSPSEEETTEDVRQSGNDYVDSYQHAQSFTKHVPKRRKRVFLSRGWMAGGYKAPTPSAPNRFVRRPQAIALSPRHFTQPTAAGRDIGGGARYAALVADPPQQLSPPFRKFHSIFTSGMWTPLGKKKRSDNLQEQTHDNY